MSVAEGPWEDAFLLQNNLLSERQCVALEEPSSITPLFSSST